MSNPASRAQRGVTVPATHLANIRLVHPACLERDSYGVGHVVDVHRHLAREQVGRARAADPELGAGETAMFVHLFGHQRVRLDVALIPKRGIGVGQVVRLRVNRTVLGADYSPATLCFHAAQCGNHARAQPAEAGAVRNLVESIFGCDRPDFLPVRRVHRIEGRACACGVSFRFL